MSLPRNAPARSYRLHRSEGRIRALVVPKDRGRLRVLRHIPVHSPDGFEIGYGGSGPADLALALAADLLGASRSPSDYLGWNPTGVEADAWAIHQALKRRYLTSLQVAEGEVCELDARELYRFALEERRGIRGRSAAVSL